MGLLRSINDWSGWSCNDVQLGQPVIDGDYFCWDDSRFPDADIEADNIEDQLTQIA